MIMTHRQPSYLAICFEQAADEIPCELEGIAFDELAMPSIASKSMCRHFIGWGKSNTPPGVSRIHSIEIYDCRFNQ
jgi:hypothetical protein